jgi:ABC-type transport system involved in multi-copper enzyme maturation permease subunit
MIRFAWLQSRTQTVTALACLGVVAVVLAITGPGLVQLYDSTVATCGAAHDCSSATASFLALDGPLQVGGSLLVLLVPGLIAMFWGAPLIAREFETGAFRLAWTQGVTRTRWLAVKLGLGTLVAMFVSGLLSLMVTWWSSRLDEVRMNSFATLPFSARDIVPVGYGAFAFVLGLSTGLLLRRTLPAMAVALAGFVGVRFAISTWLRPSLVAPLQKTMAITTSSPLSIGLSQKGVQVTATTRGLLAGGWPLSARLVDSSGRAPTTAFLDKACPFSKTTFQPNLATCIAHLSARFCILVSYQPTSHFWALQWYETAIFLGLALVLAAACFALIHRPAG